VWDKILPPEKYVSLIHKEIQSLSPLIFNRSIDTIYFGGGTPSLIDPRLLGSIISELTIAGFQLSPNCEITMEINPGTLSLRGLESLLKSGVNRFSVGVQTFNDPLLKALGRKHSVKDSLTSLKILKENNLNFSLDILFALPGQTKQLLKYDLEMALEMEPNHISTYCLTLPHPHPLAINRPNDDIQVEMFELIEAHLQQAQFYQYEISNFARKGYESQHNLIYWTDQEYWGVGLSAHSYLHYEKWGVRFWNASQIRQYELFVHSLPSASSSPINVHDSSQIEVLESHQAMTDFCHTSLRINKGVSWDALRCKFGSQRLQIIAPRLQKLEQSKMLSQDLENRWQLTRKGRLLSNQVFEELTFIAEELTSKIDRPY